jgi:hypothetical protein
MSKNRDSDMLRSLARIAPAVVLDPARIAVLICPPVSRFRVYAAALLPLWLRGPLGLDSDYIHQYLKYLGPVSQYWATTGRPILHLVKLLRHTCAPPLLNAQFQDLRSTLTAHPQVLFLFAHHSDQKIEFAGSRHSWPEVISAIPDPEPGERPCLLLDICNSENWRDALRLAFPQLRPAGGSSLMSLLDSLQMTGLFIGKCNGTRTFEEAWSLAEFDYWNASGRHIHG